MQLFAAMVWQAIAGTQTPKAFLTLYSVRNQAHEVLNRPFTSKISMRCMLNTKSSFDRSVVPLRNTWMGMWIGLWHGEVLQRSIHCKRFCTCANNRSSTPLVYKIHIRTIFKPKQLLRAIGVHRAESVNSQRVKTNRPLSWKPTFRWPRNDSFLCIAASRLRARSGNFWLFFETSSTKYVQVKIEPSYADHSHRVIECTSMKQRP